jgi:hypothetical protein
MSSDELKQSWEVLTRCWVAYFYALIQKYRIRFYLTIGLSVFCFFVLLTSSSLLALVLFDSFRAYID